MKAIYKNRLAYVGDDSSLFVGIRLIGDGWRAIVDYDDPDLLIDPTDDEVEAVQTNG